MEATVLGTKMSNQCIVLLYCMQGHKVNQMFKLVEYFNMFYDLILILSAFLQTQNVQ